MPFTRRLGIFFWLPAASALILSAPQDLTMATANSSLNSLFSASGLNLTAIANQSEQNALPSTVKQAPGINTKVQSS